MFVARREMRPSPEFNLTLFMWPCHLPRRKNMKRFLWISLFVIGFVALPHATHAETWFEEAKRIHKEADAVEPRSTTFEILPDFELAENSVKAGATFKNNGERVIVRSAQVRVELPVAKEKGNVIYKYRTRELTYNGEPAWTGRRKEPWAMGYFNYTVTATYKGNVYTKQFKVGRDGLVANR
jgi:hypothetical protein